jgi:outer membrane protein assembly factor BamB
MQFLSKKILRNTGQFYIIDNNLYCFSNGRLSKLSKDYDVLWNIEVDSQWLILESDNLISTFRQFKNVYLINKLNGLVESKSDISFRPHFFENNTLYGSYLEKVNENNTFSFGKLEKGIYNKIVDTYDYNIKILYGKEYVITQRGYYDFRCYKFDKQLWELNLNQLLLGKDVVELSEMFIIGKKVYVYVVDNADNEKYYTIILDIETGDEVFRTKEIIGRLRLQVDKVYSLYEKGISIMNTDDFSVRKIDCTKALSVLDYTFEEILETGESWGMTTKYFEFSPNIYSVSYPYLYFAQNRGSIFGVFNLESEELLWHKNMEIDNAINPVIARIEAAGGKVYVHCSDNTLHIYENDTNEV